MSACRILDNNMTNNLLGGANCPLFRSPDSQNLAPNTDKDINIQELIKANSQWQLYTKQQDSYVLQLQQQLSVAKSENENLRQQNNELLLQQNNCRESIMQECSNRVQLLEEQKKKLELENQDLVKKLRMFEDAKSRLESEPRRTASDDAEAMLLREQVAAYKEDFESERRDRERACGRLAEVQMELDIVKQQLKNFTQRESQSYLQRRQAALDYHRQEYERTHPGAAVYQTDGIVDDSGEGYDEIDG